MNPLEAKRVHFIGIGGIGVSSLARWYFAHGADVSGSDLVPTDLTRELIRLGIRVLDGNQPANIPEETQLVVYSQAAAEDNPERQAALSRGIPLLSYPQVIGEMTKRYATIGVAGAHGKSTTAALLSLALMEGGFDPTVIIGAKLTELGNSNFRSGKSEYLVLEADEYAKAFLYYFPAASIITNIDLEHVDVYPDIESIKKAFLDYMEHVSRFLVLNYEDPILRSLEPDITKLAAERGLEIFWYSAESIQAEKIKTILKITGDHNVSNAMAVYAAAQFLGASESAIIRTLSSYAGAWRRMELRGNYKGAIVYDDYAHHPTEIKATLQAFKQKHPDKTILCVFQPHQVERLTRLFNEFQNAFDQADEALILPTYKVAGRDLQAPGRTAEELVKAIQTAQPNKKLFYLADGKNITSALDSLGDLDKKVIVMMGAGDIVNLTDILVGKAH